MSELSTQDKLTALEKSVAELKASQKVSAQVTVISTVATVAYLCFKKWGAVGGLAGTVGSIVALQLISAKVQK